MPNCAVKIDISAIYHIFAVFEFESIKLPYPENSAVLVENGLDLEYAHQFNDKNFVHIHTEYFFLIFPQSNRKYQTSH
jgi:hypothetical protein